MKRKTIRILSLVIALCLLLGTVMGCTGTTTAEATATAGPESTETTDATEAPAAPGELPPSSDGAFPEGTPPEGMGNPFDQCKFNDCSHTNEPGCAVRAALEDGSLSEERWKTYVQLHTENEWGKAKMMQIARFTREYQKNRYREWNL